MQDKLYHATYKQFLNSIKTKGLGNTRRKMWSDSKTGVVYLADDPWVAESYAETSDWVEERDDPDIYLDNIVILEIDTSKLDASKLFVDSNVLLDKGEENSTWEYHGIIPWEACKIFDSSIAEDFEEFSTMWVKSPQESPDILYMIYSDFDDGSYDIRGVDANLDFSKSAFKREASDFLFPCANADQTINLVSIKVNELSEPEHREFLSMLARFMEDEWDDRDFTHEENELLGDYEKLFWSDSRFSVLYTFTDVDAYESATEEGLDPESMEIDEWRDFIDSLVDREVK